MLSLLLALALAPNPMAGADQVVVVTPPSWNSTRATLYTFARDADGAWRPVGDASPVVIGRAGAGWGRGLNAAPTSAASTSWL